MYSEFLDCSSVLNKVLKIITVSFKKDRFLEKKTLSVDLLETNTALNITYISFRKKN